MPKAYPQEFRDNVVAVAKTFMGSKAQVAKDFGISEGCLHKWVQAADATQAGDVAGSPELRRLQRELRLARQEIEILRRAAAYFARDALPK
jgi:transposase